MARERSIVSDVEACTGEEDTADNNALKATAPSELGLRTIGLFLKCHYLVLAPWIVYSAPPSTTLGQQTLVVGAIVSAGLLATFLGSKRFIVISSSALVGILVGGKVVGDLLKQGSPDTAVLLTQFVLILFLMEATSLIVDHDRETGLLRRRDDELSLRTMSRSDAWVKRQLGTNLKLGVACLLMSLGLLTLGGLSSIRVGQLALLAVFVLAAVIALFVLLTYRREPAAYRAGSPARPHR